MGTRRRYALPYTRHMGLTLLGLALLAACAAAQQLAPSHDRKARQVVYLILRSGFMEWIIPGAVDESMKTLTKETGPLSATETVRARMALERWLREVMTSGEVEDELVRIYGKHFSEPELDELLAFYYTPVGAKLLRVSGPMTAELASGVTENIRRSPVGVKRLRELMRQALPDRTLPF